MFKSGHSNVRKCITLTSLVTRTNSILFVGICIFPSQRGYKGFNGSFHCFSNGCMFVTKITNSQQESQISNNSSEIDNMPLGKYHTIFPQSYLHRFEHSHTIHCAFSGTHSYENIKYLCLYRYYSLVIHPKLSLQPSRQNDIVSPMTRAKIIYSGQRFFYLTSSDKLRQLFGHPISLLIHNLRIIHEFTTKHHPLIRVINKRQKKGTCSSPKFSTKPSAYPSPTSTLQASNTYPVNRGF